MKAYLSTNILTTVRLQHISAKVNGNPVHGLVMVSCFFPRGDSDTAIADLFLNFGFAVFIKISLLPLPSFLCSSLIDALAPNIKTVALCILLSDHHTAHVIESSSIDTTGEVFWPE